MWILGLDEAGRGSVLGPMVVGAFLVSADALPLLRGAGADDSKRLSPARRARALDALLAHGHPDVEVVSAAEIDGGNLNHIEEQVFIRMILRHRPDLVQLDAPCHPAAIPALIRRLQAAVRPLQPSFVVEPKADATYPAVGAASIAAKLRRDAEIAALGPIGSGYPSDPVTRAHLLSLMQSGDPLPPYVRTRWGTLDKLRQGGLF
jgi:ribonuclease HII